MASPSDEGEHVCDACGRSFESDEALEEHIHDVGLVD